MTTACDEYTQINVVPVNFVWNRLHQLSPSLRAGSSINQCAACKFTCTHSGTPNGTLQNALLPSLRCDLVAINAAFSEMAYGSHVPDALRFGRLQGPTVAPEAPAVVMAPAPAPAPAWAATRAPDMETRWGACTALAMHSPSASCLHCTQACLQGLMLHHAPVRPVATLSSLRQTLPCRHPLLSLL